MMIAVDPVDENYISLYKYFFNRLKLDEVIYLFLKETIHILKKESQKN